MRLSPSAMNFRKVVREEKSICDYLKVWGYIRLSVSLRVGLEEYLKTTIGLLWRIKQIVRGFSCRNSEGIWPAHNNVAAEALEVKFESLLYTLY